MKRKYLVAIFGKPSRCVKKFYLLKTNNLNANSENPSLEKKKPFTGKIKTLRQDLKASEEFLKSQRRLFLFSVKEKNILR